MDRVVYWVFKVSGQPFFFCFLKGLPLVVKCVQYKPGQHLWPTAFLLFISVKAKSASLHSETSLASSHFISVSRCECATPHQPTSIWKCNIKANRQQLLQNTQHATRLPAFSPLFPDRDSSMAVLCVCYYCIYSMVWYGTHNGAFFSYEHTIVQWYGSAHISRYKSSKPFPPFSCRPECAKCVIISCTCLSWFQIAVTALDRWTRTRGTVGS